MLSHRFKHPLGRRSYLYRDEELGIKIKYCGKDCLDDKPYIESFFSRSKGEEVYRNEYSSFIDVMLEWIQYKYWYQTEQIHQGLGWRSIPDFKKQEGSHLAGTFQFKNTGLERSATQSGKCRYTISTVYH